MNCANRWILSFSCREANKSDAYASEVDFVAVRDDERAYIQVADNLASQTTRERELRLLRSIRDAHPKMAVVRKGTYERDVARRGVSLMPTAV